LFQTADGYMNIGAAGEAIYQRFCKVIDAPFLASDPDFATNADRSKNRARLHEAISAITRGRTTAAWIDLLNQAGVPCGPIYRMDEVFADPQVRHLNITRHVQHKVLGDVEVVGQAIELSRTPWSVRSASPEPGEHTDDVLRELGYDAAEIAGLRERKVV
jgi:crotonobetainyl-CoA:carnitine CoA-transferase CaiB-like acyl-CoA transferase